MRRTYWEMCQHTIPDTVTASQPTLRLAVADMLRDEDGFLARSNGRRVSETLSVSVTAFDLGSLVAAVGCYCSHEAMSTKKRSSR